MGRPLSTTPYPAALPLLNLRAVVRESGQHAYVHAAACLINPSRFGQIICGNALASPAERERIVAHFGIDEAVLFATESAEVSA
jgi:hypothetical protein